MHRSLHVLLASLAFACVAAASSSRVTLERVSHRGADLQGWHQSGKASPEQPIELVVAVKQRNLEAFEELFYEVADPESPKYGKFLTREEVQAFVEPAAESFSKTLSWLRRDAPRATKVYRFFDFIVAEMTVEDAENLLDCEYYLFEHAAANMTAVRALQYTVPSQVASHIDFVGGVLHLHEPQLNAKKASNHEKQRFGKTAKRQEVGVYPSVLRELFNATGVKAGTTGNRQAVASFLKQYFSTIDLEEFYLLFWDELLGTSPSRVIGKQGFLPGVEANLDVQYMTSVGSHVDTWVYSTADLHDGQEPFLKWSMLVLNESDAEIPKTISVSYGDVEATIDYAYAARVNVEMQKLGLRGVSVMFASGDSGATCNAKGTAFQPNFPAELPSVTAVGGIEYGGGEWSGDYISSGGFSNYFAQPSYQKKAVSDYLNNAKNLPPTSFFNRTGRAFPDVAAPSESFYVVTDLIPSPVGGTSCASPSFTAVISLLNDARIKNGQKSLGFLNPMLYSLSTSQMQPVKSGCNAGCATTSNRGFCIEAQRWAPVSGLGYPNYGLLKEKLVTMA